MKIKGKTSNSFY